MEISKEVLLKRFVLIVAILLLGHYSFGQNQSVSKDLLLFEKALTLQELVEEDLDDLVEASDTMHAKQELVENTKYIIFEKSLGYYNELIDSFPKSHLLLRALNNKGFLELELDEPDEAKKTFLKVLNSNADDKEPGGLGSGIMAEPYANFKNRAAKALANIEIKDSNYKEAISYLELAEKYPYQHFCGNAQEADEIYMAVLYAKCHIGLNEPEKAIDVLLPDILENGFADNSDLVDLAYILLLRFYTKEDLKIRYEQAFKNYEVKTIKSEFGKYKEYSIVFLNKKLMLYSWRLEFLEPSEISSEIEKIYKSSRFYKLLHT